MKILFLVNSPVGLYKFRHEVVDAFKSNHDVVISTPPGDFVDYFVQTGCRINICNELHTRGTNPLDEYKLLQYYKRLLKAEKPDIVFTYTIKPNVYGGYLCGKYNISYVANITGLGTTIENAGMMQKLSLMLYKRGLKKAQKVYFQNSENQRFMIERKIIDVAYDLLPGSGVNLNDYKYMEYPSDGKIVFMFISRILKEKGIDQYLDAAQEIKKRYSKSEFHVCGECDDAYETKLKQLNDDGVIIYHGNVKNISEMQKINCCTIHPTYYAEGMSNVLLESAACGRPIITTNRPGCREIIDDGCNGFLVKEKDSQSLIDAIDRFIKLPYEERVIMGKRGRAKVEQEFDRNIVVDKYLNELSALKK